MPRYDAPRYRADKPPRHDWSGRPWIDRASNELAARCIRRLFRVRCALFGYPGRRDHGMELLNTESWRTWGPPLRLESASSHSLGPVFPAYSARDELLHCYRA